MTTGAQTSGAVPVNAQRRRAPLNASPALCIHSGVGAVSLAKETRVGSPLITPPMEGRRYDERTTE